MAKMTGLEKRMAQWSRFSTEVREAVEAELKKEVDEMVAAIQRAAPVSDFEARPGELRDSVTAYPVQGRPAAWRIIVKAQDKKGRYYGSYVEFGHGTEDGGRVPARPFFWPTYRSRRRGLRARILRPARKLIREMFPRG
jgi:hypothetical protein